MLFVACLYMGTVSRGIKPPYLTIIMMAIDSPAIIDPPQKDAY